MLTMTGAWVSDEESVTATTNAPLAELPRASEAVHDTVVVPIGKVEPDGGVHCTATAPSTRSAAVALNAAAAPVGLVAGRERFPGSVSAGGVVSTTVTRKLAVLPVSLVQ